MSHLGISPSLIVQDLRPENWIETKRSDISFLAPLTSSKVALKRYIFTGNQTLVASQRLFGKLV
ncbi:hypothetical protein, partial [Paenibacillus tyrfis]|uniref:hypothetical protein n=1 Tax=Paenibacillus tyrfis TaxID=1501230 RepID=UPI00209DBF5E